MNKYQKKYVDLLQKYIGKSIPEKLEEMFIEHDESDSDQKILIADLQNLGDEYLSYVMVSVPADKQNEVAIRKFDFIGVTFSGYEASGYEAFVNIIDSSNDLSAGLNEKVWMLLSLSSRCVGGKEQNIIYDDLCLPKLDIVSGWLKRRRDPQDKGRITWDIKNAYLRKYLYLRNHYGFKVFYYENKIDLNPVIQSHLDSNSYFIYKDKDKNFNFDIRKSEKPGKVHFCIWGVIPAIDPVLCPELDKYTLTWPGDPDGVMTEYRSKNLASKYPFIYVKDTFLKIYEENNIYYVNPESGHVSYNNKWGLGRTYRINRDIIMIEVKKLYECSNHIIFDVHKHAIPPISKTQKEKNKEKNIAKRVQDLKNALQTLNVDL